MMMRRRRSVKVWKAPPFASPAARTLAAASGTAIRSAPYPACAHRYAAGSRGRDHSRLRFRPRCRCGATLAAHGRSLPTQETRTMSTATTIPPAGAARPPTTRNAKKHPVDELLPLPKLATYGFQHVLAFYAGAVLVPIILAGALHLSEEQLIHLINADLFTCGIASIIQAAGFWKIGVRLPLLQGVTFTAVSPMIAMGMSAGGGVPGLLTIYGSVLCAGLFTFFAAPYFAKLLRFFHPVVTGTLILIIGVALLPVAANDIVHGNNPSVIQQHVALKDLLYAFGTLGLIVLIQRMFTGFMATVAVLVGLVAGTLVAWLLGDASFAGAATAPMFGYTSPFYFGMPTFNVTAVLSMIIVMMITMVETRSRAVAGRGASACRTASRARWTR